MRGDTRLAVWLLMLAISLVTGMAAEQTNAVAGATRKEVLELIQQLGADSHKAREKATAALLASGPSIVPFVADGTNHPDPEIAYRVRTVLRRVRGIPGEEVEGLTLAATLVGARPVRGQAVAVSFAICNNSAQDIYLFRYMWDLKLQMVNPCSGSRSLCAHSPATIKANDFYRLKPGETLCVVMDADPDSDVQGADVAKVRLEVAMPDDARAAAPGPLFSGREELISGPVEISFADPSPETEPRARALATAVGRGEAGAEKTLAAASERAKAVRWGLRLPEAEQRWRMFQFACRYPSPDFEDDIVEFLSRFGARVRSETEQMKLLAAYAAQLPAERRWPFINRMAMAISYDWRSLSSLVLGYSSSEDPAERAEAARLALRLHESGVRLARALSFLVWELYTTPDTTLRNTTKAVELAKAGLEQDPDNATLRLAHAAFSDDKAAMRRTCDGADTAEARNNLAYEMTARFPVGAVDASWALTLANKAIEETPEEDSSFPYFADTLAGAYAYSGDYRQALVWQEKALARVAADDGERPGMAARTAYYVALSGGEPADRPRVAIAVPPLKSLKARDAVLVRLATEADRDVRATLVKLLATCYPSDAKVKEALDTLSKDQPVAPGR
jgi:tetratricopeptide (TPR) repeat protein